MPPCPALNVLSFKNVVPLGEGGREVSVAVEDSHFGVREKRNRRDNVILSSLEQEESAA